MRYTWKVTKRLHDRASWDMHSHGAEIVKPEHDRLQADAAVTGTVVCHHAFGLGMFLPDRDEYGHVNITEVKPGVVRGPEDFPAIGSSVEGIVLGYTGIHSQLRISLRQVRSSYHSDMTMVPVQSHEDTDVGWGEQPEQKDDERLYLERPPHWDFL